MKGFGRLIFREPIVLMGLTLIAYGVFAFQQGYHWDDWGLLGLFQLGGSQALLDYFALARPLWGYVYLVTLSLLGTNPTVWQGFALLMRWLAALGLWWSLRLTWPRWPRFAFWATALALVYPGFRQHSIAIAYGHHALMLAIFYTSLGLSLWTLRHTRWKTAWQLLAVALSLFHLFSSEYFFGLEIVRPLFFWAILNQENGSTRQRFQRLWRAWWPYALVILAFLIWRGLFFESQLYALSAQPSTLLASLPAQIGNGLWNASLLAWAQIFQWPPPEQMGPRLTLLYTTLLLIALVGLLFYDQRRFSRTASEEGPIPSPWKTWLAIGVMALLTAGIPFYLARLPIQLKFPEDRFTQPFALGTALLIATVLEHMPSRAWRTLLASLLVTLAIGLQIQFAFAFREDWKRQKAYFWQLAWRVPGLQSGTAILSERSPFAFTDDDALTVATNWLYGASLTGQWQYQHISIATRLEFNPDTMQFTRPIEGKLQWNDFVVNPQQILVVQFAPPSCLRVLHPIYDADLPVAPRSRSMTETLLSLGFPLMRREEAAALPRSAVHLVIPDPQKPAHPPQVIFGAEPPHTWCYYFEKADLARSRGDWAEVAHLGDQAFARSYQPDNLAEYLPFIEAYLHVGQIEKAKTLTLEVAQQMPILRPALCAIWQRQTPALLSQNESWHLIIQQMKITLQYCPVEEQ